MRKILFRGKKRSNGEWIMGCYFIAKDKEKHINHYISEIEGKCIIKFRTSNIGHSNIFSGT